MENAVGEDDIEGEAHVMRWHFN